MDKKLARKNIQPKPIEVNSYFEIYKGFCDKFEFVPDDITMNRLAILLGRSRSIAAATRADLQKMDYEFTKTHNGFFVKVPKKVDPGELRHRIEELEWAKKEISNEITKQKTLLKSSQKKRNHDLPANH